MPPPAHDGVPLLHILPSHTPLHAKNTQTNLHEVVDAEVVNGRHPRADLVPQPRRPRLLRYAFVVGVVVGHSVSVGASDGEGRPPSIDRMLGGWVGGSAGVNCTRKLACLVGGEHGGAEAVVAGVDHGGRPRVVVVGHLLGVGGVVVVWWIPRVC